MEHLQHITPEELERYGVVSAPDILSGTPRDNKALFDRMVANMVAPKVNAVIDVENQLIDAESIRDEGETGRVVAEGGRVIAETNRVDAESTRASGEVGRAGAEGARVVAETLRTHAEEGREQAERVRADETAGIVARATVQADRAEGAKTGAETARAGAESAAGIAAEQTVRAAEGLLDEYVDAAGRSAANAEGAQVQAGGFAATAKVEADRAKAEADRASEIVGKDFPTRTEVQGYIEAHDGAPDAHRALFEAAALDAQAKADAAEKASKPVGWTPAWGEVRDKPTVFPPSVHGHTKGDITDFPATMPPSAHSHTPQELGVYGKSETLTPGTAALYGLGAEAVPDRVLAGLAYALPWVRVAAWEAAGTYTWTAPNLYGDGRSYEIGVCVIGGGGSGNSTDSNWGAIGGAAGYMSQSVMTVSPGVGYPCVVGAGGQGVINPRNSFERGKHGGSSSFGGILVANGGEGGYPGDFSTSFAISYGGVAGTSAHGTFGGTGNIGFSQSYRGVVNLNFTLNVFELKLCLGSGAGGASTSNVGGKNPLTGKGGGNVIYNGVGDGNASEPGCGGGASVVNNELRYTSGKGADGAVYLYARRIRA